MRFSFWDGSNLGLLLQVWFQKFYLQMPARLSSDHLLVAAAPGFRLNPSFASQWLVLTPAAPGLPQFPGTVLASSFACWPHLHLHLGSWSPSGPVLGLPV